MYKLTALIAVTSLAGCFKPLDNCVWIDGPRNYVVAAPDPTPNEPSEGGAEIGYWLCEPSRHD